MSNASSSPNVLNPNSFSGIGVGTTVNDTAVSCSSSEIDYTLYFKVMLFLLFVMAGALVSGFSASAGAIRSLALAVQDHRQHTHRVHTQDVEARSSTSPLNEDDAPEKVPEAGPARMAPAVGPSESDSDLYEDSSYSSSPPLPPPPTRQSRGHKLWTKVQDAVSDSAWPTLALNTANVAATFVLSGPSSLLYSLPTPVTDPGPRSN
ncbi:hypothetical protein GSI_02915 [Ganoderma sinense ZZ0214-1]|uniref:Uncharacterized protein n=1 Tax=Ganoderma sinense ZZ0214-1 TaxID=1077348 RepID=A0A2G8SMY1_9APHY|nr:hypothetical protein GSI_02915 [Ganoderma sinense ZZ0214-1]